MKLTKAQQRERQRSADVALMLHMSGGSYSPTEHLPWTFPTKAGTLYASDSGPMFLHLRFEHPQVAADVLGVSGLYNGLGLNPYSGKWNIHAPAEEMERELGWRLEMVTS